MSLKNQPQKGKHIILFDGVCGLCNRLNQYVLAKDSSRKFMFASLQSDFASDILSRYNRDSSDLTTVYVVADYDTNKERLLSHSDAAIFVLSKLGSPFKLSALAMILPKEWRDSLYKLISKHRYRVFGRNETCLLPDEKYEQCFIEI